MGCSYNSLTGAPVNAGNPTDSFYSNSIASKPLALHPPCCVTRRQKRFRPCYLHRRTSGVPRIRSIFSALLLAAACATNFYFCGILFFFPIFVVACAAIRLSASEYLFCCKTHRRLGGWKVKTPSRLCREAEES